MTTLDAERRLSLTRRFDASPDRLFDAWTDPNIAARWLFTTPQSDFHSTEIDARIGGRWAIIDHRDGKEERALGEFLEVDRPHRLVFTFEMPEYGPGADQITVEIRPDGAGAILTLVQERVPPEHRAGAERGWREMFDLLDRVAIA